MLEIFFLKWTFHIESVIPGIQKFENDSNALFMVSSLD